MSSSAAVPPARRSASRAARVLLFALALLVAAPLAAAAQETVCDPGDVEVRGLEFVGNEAFSDAELARGIAITPSSWIRRTLGVFGTRRCVDRGALRLDVARLAIYYRKRGFLGATVDTVVREVGPEAIAVRFLVEEGPALRVDTLTVSGLEAVPPSVAQGELGIRVGDRFDQYVIDSARYVLVRRLRDGGYPFADVLSGFRTHTATRSAAVEFDAIPGPMARLGEVRLDVAPREGTTQQVPDDVLRGLLGLRPGQRYRERELVDAQRRLYQTDAFAHVEIALDSSRAGAADSVVDVRVGLRETYMRSARVGVGYGTLDCFRVSGEYTNVNFLKQARRLELNGRMSKIGVGAPLDVAEGLCFADVRDDTFSDTLNYYLGATLRAPILFGLTFPTVTLYSERRSEFKAFMRMTPIAVGVARSWAWRRGTPITASYNLEYGRTAAQPALFCAAFNLCSEEDRARVVEFRRLAVVGLALERGRTDNPVEPTRGAVARVDARHASRLVGSDPLQQFNQLTGTFSAYRPITEGVVLAGRVRLGAVLGSTFANALERFVPPQERLYAGGPSTVRGFRQNELGPVAYLARTYVDDSVSLTTGERIRVFRTAPDSGYARVVPLGGNSVLVTNLELRVRSPVWPELLQFTLFADAGKVSRDIDFGLSGLRWTPGVGMRISTPVGPIRLDLGYNPYALSAGAAYFDAPLDVAVAPLYCVSPGNRFRVEDREVDGRVVPVQETGGRDCPATFQPVRGRGFWRRLTPSFSIGQAF